VTNKILNPKSMLN